MDWFFDVSLSLWRAGRASSGARKLTVGDATVLDVLSDIYATAQWDEDVDRDLVEFKSTGERTLGEGYAAVFSRAVQTLRLPSRLVLGIPTYLGPGARRKFDPIDLVLQMLASGRHKGVDLLVGASNPITKLSDTPKISGMSGAPRRAIAETLLRESLSLTRPAAIRDKNILLVDDVVTEGWTMREVGRVLRAAGAASVSGLAIFWRNPATVTTAAASVRSAP